MDRYKTSLAVKDEMIKLGSSGKLGYADGKMFADSLTADHIFL